MVAHTAVLVVIESTASILGRLYAEGSAHRSVGGLLGPLDLRPSANYARHVDRREGLPVPEELRVALIQQGGRRVCVASVDRTREARRCPVAVRRYERHERARGQACSGV